MADEELKVLKKKRASLKSKLTIFEKFVKSVEGLQTDTEPLERSKIIEIEQRLQDAQQLISQFDDTQTEIECILDDFDSQLPEREEFSNRFYDILTIAKTIIEVNTHSDKLSEVEVASHTSAQSSLSDLPDAVKLPEIELPKFDGLFQNWLEFRDIFQSLIHENSRINNIQKFHYLRASLIGAAPQVIQSIEFCGTNYQVAWKILCERFNNTNLLIQNHLNAIFNSETINSESAVKIRNLSDNLFKHLASLKQLGEPTEQWDTIIIYVVSAKLDPCTARDWERLKAKQRTSCTLEYFKNFFKEKADILENTEINLKTKQNDFRQTKQSNYENKRTYKTSRGFHANTNANDKTNNTKLNEGQAKYTCFFCNGNHSLFYCAEFLRLSVDDRFSKAKDLQLCVNCLRRNHIPKDCKWSGCKLCSLKHNTILHGIKEYTNTVLTVNQINDDPNDLETDYNSTTCTIASAQNALLSTAQVYCRDITGNLISARALLDCGSQSSFMTNALCKKLKLATKKTDLTITGISDKITHSTERCQLKIRSKINTFSFEVSCFVLDKITSDLPGMSINNKALNIPQHFKLADPTFDISGKIDLLLGADVFWNLLTSGKQELAKNGLILQNTRIGWIVSGPLAQVENYTICNLSKNVLLQNQLAKFWEVEEISNKKPLSNEETFCEKHFIDTLEYSTDGRFVVSLPLKDSPQKLGNTRELAIKRFVSLERKLLSNDKLRTLYVSFLQEYERLGHMTEVRDNSENAEAEYYLPHHGVLKETSSTTKLRVVFNASAPSTTGLSLNSLQMTGPTIQSDLFSILLRFRTRAIVISADIKMMYRQVLINPNQRNLQKIVWRSSPNETIKSCQLNTVTYGTTAGSFLAIRSLHQVAIECESEHPKIAKIIKEDMYVDDLLTGVDSPEEAEYVVKTIYEILLKRGFELRKWQSNELSFNNTDEDLDTVECNANKDHDTKVLGLLWACRRDILTFKISPTKNINPKGITKRVVLSRIATIFDPLGLTSPCIIIAKVLLQKLWAENLTWDQPLPSYILSSWIQFSSELDTLNEVIINRHVTCQSPNFIALHGFSDASETSYGACIYVVSKNKNGNSECNLLCAKSKVAPLKSLTIPRLELCAALILAQLLTKVLESISINIDKVYCWSDSTIVLGWLQTSPNLLKQFVDNRVAEIQKLTSTFIWNHVPTQENPADLVSRGLKPNQLINSALWWHGPKWLPLDKNEWPINNIFTKDLPEMRNCLLMTKTKIELFPFERFSSLTRIKRTAAYIFRFITNTTTSKHKRLCSSLTLSEINDAFNRLIKLSQLESFPDEISILASKRELPKTTSILSLHPFIDNQGILRVGGRLSNSEYSYSKKYPILLSPNHVLSKLIMRYEHEHLLHAGPQLLLSHVRDTFWPIAGRNLARQTVRNCVKCCRYNPQSVQPIMGDLPTARVHQALPFIKVGVDYAGPFLVKDRRGRGCKVIKCWVAVFVCMTTRAMHLELVLSLSSEDFLQAFIRFISKRGRPLEVFSDNGTSFVRTDKDLQAMGNFLKESSALISESIQNLGIKWHFIPANSPHFGGIWEAGVKSFKYHFKRIVGSYTLFLFDLQTLLARIEAVLNSRPICPLSSDPDDFSSLTPAHFLIGRSTMTIAEPSVMDLPDNRLSQYQLVQKVQEQFWNRWHREYINELQQRPKWKVNNSNLHLGQLVLVKDNNLPPMKWRLGRILNFVSGKDNINRVASIKTSDGILTRAVVRLCPLPC